MRIFYDGKIYQSQRAGGINRYFAKIIGQLPLNWSPTLATSRKLDINFPKHSNIKLVTSALFSPPQISSRLMRSRFQYELRHGHYDIVHPTYYSLLAWKNINQCKKPIVLSVWDMVHEIFPQTMDPHGQHAILKRRAIEKADIIICISENTKNDLFKFYGEHLEDKVYVTHLASGMSIEQSYVNQKVPKHPYLLYVGSRSPYKGFSLLLKAFEYLQSGYADLCLCVVGEPFSISEYKEISLRNLSSKVICLGVVNDHHLAKLYRCSIAFVYPSSYEGFGIPPLEAMSCGTAVIASNSSSLPEVVGKAGLLFDPHSIDDFLDKLIFILDNPIKREKIVADGFEHVKKFSWSKTVKETLEIYKSFS